MNAGNSMTLPSRLRVLLLFYIRPQAELINSAWWQWLGAINSLTASKRNHLVHFGLATEDIIANFCNRVVAQRPSTPKINKALQL